MFRQVHRIDLGVGESQCGQYGQATGTGAQVKHIVYVFRICDPGVQRVDQQFRDWRPRHDDTREHEKTVRLHPGFSSKVGGWNTLAKMSIELVEVAILLFPK